jgi:hypothetical protein
MVTRPSTSTKQNKPRTVVGRSAVTGRVVLTPASKDSTRALKRASEAVGRVLHGKAKP